MYDLLINIHEIFEFIKQWNIAFFFVHDYHNATSNEILHFSLFMTITMLQQKHLWCHDGAHTGVPLATSNNYAGVTQFQWSAWYKLDKVSKNCNNEHFPHNISMG